MLVFRADLDERDVGEPGLHVLPQHLDVLAGIRAAWHQRGDVVLGDVLGGGVEGAGIGELGHHVPSGQRPAP